VKSAPNALLKFRPSWHFKNVSFKEDKSRTFIIPELKTFP